MTDPSRSRLVSGIEQVGASLEALQDRICDALSRLEPSNRPFDAETHHDDTSHSWSRVLHGDTFERAAVLRTAARGERLPPTLRERRPELAGHGFESHSLSLIVHPTSPFVPTVHANLRCFVVRSVDAPVDFWFGGGFDLTPCYGFEEDAVHFHRSARDACAPFGEHLYPRFKKACDEYFYLPHRGETRGIGGLLFDDLDTLAPLPTDQPATATGTSPATEPSPATAEQRFAACSAFLRSVGDHVLPAYLPLVERRLEHAWGDRERAFQSYRRGRYVEFNLLYDRGTRYGLATGRRTESVLSALPPRAEWRYDWSPAPDSAEARLARDFLRPRDWLGLTAETSDEAAPG